MDLRMSHQAAKRYVDMFGWEALLNALERKALRITPRRLELYSVSMDWHVIGPEFCLKAKGARGDVLVRWA